MVYNSVVLLTMIRAHLVSGLEMRFLYLSGGLKMPQGIPEEIIDEIRQRTDLVGLIGDYLKLERRGKNMVGLCPFHSEKTPSFTVSPEKQLFHCFGCGASGNAFSLIMQMENLPFPEAARFLANRVGVRIPEPTKTASAEDNLKERIYKLNLLAVRYYAHCLKNTPAGNKAREYLLKRGITPESIELFMLGYSPADWSDFYNYARQKGAQPELMIKAGLVSPGKDKGYYDRFRNRVMFPIFNISGKAVGFGGRSLTDDQKSGPKYLNSPETPVFSKGQMLYALNLAREAIRREKKAVVMEGYTDVIAVYQAGIKNVVASLGTALTAEQGRLLRHQAETVVTAYDADSAGEAATWRGLAVLQSTGCLVQVAELPAGSDPDSYVRAKGKDAFSKLVENAVPLMEYRLQQLKKRFNLASDKGRIDYIEELLPFLLAAVNEVEQDFYLKKASEELGVDENALRSELKKRRKMGTRYQDAEKSKPALEAETIKIRPAEKILLSLMLQSKEIAELGRNLLQTEFIDDPRVRQVIAVLWDISASETIVSAEKLINRFADQQITRLITEAVTDPSLQDIPPQIAKRMAEDCIGQLYHVWSEQRQRELQQKIKELEAQGSDEQLAALLKEHQQMLTNKDGNPYRLGKGGDFNG
jgi:DNA primase